jgi:Flp pilus assembly protein TadB
MQTVPTMHTVPFSTNEIPPEQLSAVIAEHLTLEHVRAFRQLLVFRCAVIAAGIAFTGLILGLVHSFGYWFSVVIFLAAPACTWVVEQQRERQFARKLERLSGVTTDAAAHRCGRKS